MRYLRKKNCIVASVLAFAAALLLFVGAPLEAKAYIQTQGTVISDSAVIRKSPNADSEAIASIVKGNKVTINNEEKDAGGVVWYKVFVDANTLGYVRSDLIQKEGGSNTATTDTPKEEPKKEEPKKEEPAKTEPEKPAINTDAEIGASTAVTEVESQGASVTSDGVRVRAEASANSTIVTQVNKSMAITVNGKADGADGKVWYLVSFIVDGKEVKGFIRSDFVQLSQELVVKTEETQPEPEQTEDPMDALPEEPIEEPVVNNDFELKYEADAEGINDWYLYNNVEGVRNKLGEILDAAEGNGDAVDTAEQQLKKQKIIIIILAIILVFLALAVTLLLFKVRDMYEEDFDDDFDEEPARPARNSDAPRSVNPAQRQRPAPRPAGGQQRPANGQARPAGGQQRPANGQARPAGGQQRPANGQPRPAGGQQRPANGQARPAGGQQRPSNGQARPAGQTQRPSNGQPRPQASQERPVQTAKPDAGWKPKNFMAEDDDLEFEFLNWDGEEH